MLDATTRQPAVGALPVDLVRSPDATGPGGAGRYLVAVNSGYGLQFSAATNKAQQSLALIDLNAQPAPVVVENIYFPTPQSANVGVVFAPKADADGTYALYVAGGVENKIWLFRFRADGHPPVTPTNGSNTKVEAPFIDVNGFADAKANPRYNANNALVYPTGLAISADGDTLYVANNLGDSLGVIRNLHGARRLEHIRLTGQSSAQTSTEHFIYPYGVVAATTGRGGAGASNAPAKVYVSCWNDASIAVVDTAGSARHVAYIPVARHPTKMLWDSTRARLFVVNSNADSVSVID
ncbi:MAG TPA: hypothetical protein VE821_13865, partial [Pyrinomonadaceae bacterium]|nr:hypothetical protein [Pyrinomonadaceae bacterium]